MVKNDFVRTPEYVTRILLKRENFFGSVLEPCCGDGAISEVLKVFSSDKYNYGYGKVIDLFDIKEKYDNIITNPPFTHQQSVKKHLLSIVKDKLALLWYIKNIGNEVETRTSENLKTIYVITRPIQWKETKLGWLFGWYIWEKGYKGDVKIIRVNPEEV